MRYLELTLPTPEENLALDEALLEEAEEADRPTETLRIWEPDASAVVIGRSSKIDREVLEETCRADGVPMLRRASGGAAIVTGPGCLMYAVVLSYRRRPGLRMIDHAHQFVLQTMAKGIATCVPEIRARGISDLVLDDLKFSGNSVRCKREHLLYHGTLLYDFSLDLISRYLKMPPHQPEYRRSRQHGAFVTNLPVEGAALRRAIRDAWRADTPRRNWPRDRTARLVAEKYGRPEWHEGRRATR